MKKKVNYSVMIGYFLIFLVVSMALVGLFYTPYPPNEMNVLEKNQAPSFTHFFGTDPFGRDIFSRVLEGASTSFFIAISVVFIGALIGSFLGAITAYYGGILDAIIMRMTDVLAAFPSVLLAICFVAVIGPGTYNLILALGIVFIPSFARVVRSEVLVQKELDYVKNAKLMGASDLRIMFVHILPNTTPILFSTLAIGFNNAVLAEAGMSYLSLGVQPPDASLGRMLSEAQTYLLSAPWYAMFTGGMIIVTVLGVALIKEAWNDR